MAFFNVRSYIEGLVAGEQLKDDQFKIVKLDSNGKVVKAAAGEGLGVLQNKPNNDASTGGGPDRSCSVAVGGRSKVKMAPNTSGRPQPGDLVSSDANGFAAKATTGQQAIGRYIGDAQAQYNEIITVSLDAQKA